MKDQNTLYQQLQSGFAPPGVKLPDLATLVSSKDGTVPNDTPPVEA